MDSAVRPVGEQRRLLVATIRATAQWRNDKAHEFEDSDVRKQNFRARQALRTLANFVEGLPDDDLDLNLYALRRADARDGRLWLTPDGAALLSRFGLGRGAWQSSQPSESQMRNILRRVDGIEAQERHASKERAEAGYGDE
jgi:hypothetical protein